MDCLILTHWGWDEIYASLQITFSNALSSMKINSFWLKFISKGLIYNIPSLVQIMAGAQQGDKPYYLNKWWLSYWCRYGSLSMNEFTSTKFINPSASWLNVNSKLIWAKRWELWISWRKLNHVINGLNYITLCVKWLAILSHVHKSLNYVCI